MKNFGRNSKGTIVSKMEVKFWYCARTYMHRRSCCVKSFLIFWLYCVKSVFSLANSTIYLWSRSRLISSGTSWKSTVLIKTSGLPLVTIQKTTVNQTTEKRNPLKLFCEWRSFFVFHCFLFHWFIVQFHLQFFSDENVVTLILLQ